MKFTSDYCLCDLCSSTEHIRDLTVVSVEQIEQPANLCLDCIITSVFGKPKIQKSLYDGYVNASDFQKIQENRRESLKRLIRIGRTIRTK